jgi:TRAP-type C4-dicarboxylate transport system permease small subunit
MMVQLAMWIVSAVIVAGAAFLFLMWVAGLIEASRRRKRNAMAARRTASP